MLVVVAGDGVASVPNMSIEFDMGAIIGAAGDGAGAPNRSSGFTGAGVGAATVGTAPNKYIGFDTGADTEAVDGGS